MLGFRYLHTRYKTWFRILWAFILFFFLGLTIYQVTDRISYYFIRNPLKTQRIYDTPTEMPFPTVIICNKLQIKASALATMAPGLLSLMAELSEDDGTVTADQKLICEYGKARSCFDDIRPIFTPKGVCYEVAPNMTVRRPVYSEGIHLEAGKVVTIPVNDVRKLFRYESECGRRGVGPFNRTQYSRGACQWARQAEAVEKLCGCRPAISPHHRAKFFAADSDENPHFDNNIPAAPHMKKKKRRTKAPPPCTIRQEYECALNVTVGRLNPNDIESLLPSDWEDIKERKIDRIQPALELIPNHRIPVVRSVQQLASEAGNFLDMAIKILNVTSSNSSLVPCLVMDGIRVADRTIGQIFTRERIWRNIETYLELVFPHNMEAIFGVLGLHMTPNYTLEYVELGGRVDDRLLDTALHNIDQIEISLRDPATVFGLKSMDPHDRAPVVHAVRHLFVEAGVCLSKVSDEINRLESSESTLRTLIYQCRTDFAAQYEMLAESHRFMTSLDSHVFSDYETMVYRLTSALQRVRFQTHPKIFNWHDHRIHLRDFVQLYKEGGKDHQEMGELMKLRKIINLDLAEAVHHLRQMKQCMKDIVPKLQPLRRSPFVRAEWMSRLERLVEQAQAYSPGIQYDRVNLLHVKLYYAHFKQEIIRQEKSYNLFLLLAEIGGTIGLYVGATLLTAAETFVFFIEKKTRRILLKPQFC
ncbi:unnamed protein product, partial [Mesorhabditis spiculigera]